MSTPTTSPSPITTRNISSASLEWGKQHEEVALKLYQEKQHRSGHSDLFYSSSGFVISKTHPFLGVSPDAIGFDPSHEAIGVADVKCPYSSRTITTFEVAKNNTYCSTFKLVKKKKSDVRLQLKHTHAPQLQSSVQLGYNREKLV